MNSKDTCLTLEERHKCDHYLFSIKSSTLKVITLNHYNKSRLLQVFLTTLRGPMSHGKLTNNIAGTLARLQKFAQIDMTVYNTLWKHSARFNQNLETVKTFLQVLCQCNLVKLLVNIE